MDMYAGGQRSGNINMNFGAEDNAKVVRHSTSEVYVRFLVGLPAASAPNIALGHRIPASSDFHQS